jgi:hypothetical protein
MSITQSEMKATGQRNRPNIIICRHQEPVVSMVITRIENPVMILRLVLLQSIADQFYDSCTIIITQTIVQLIGPQSSLINLHTTMCILKIRGEQCRYVLPIRAIIAFIVYYQSSRIMERDYLEASSVNCNSNKKFF